ncbi:SDR family NAD(P)-dependent oxidoreductase [Lentzea sp. NPDC003310]|uniref:SDR family NAD(P)-dependent oxidoreductase n=1 Tax=Lentzea sp. NPDC003310 TaxID=3154447 RepID=UPI0033B87B51
MTWTPPDLTGRTYAVTGGTAGIGRHLTDRLTEAGAEVVTLARGGRATVRLDLADLDSVAAAAARLSELDRLDGLVLNAGTNDDQRAFATNHLGHFALTALTLPSLTGGRVVSTGSVMTRFVKYDPHDEKSYAQSKHAVLLFAFELDRRLRRSGVDVRSLAAHPGLAVENLPLRWPVQSKARGAWPALRALTDPDAAGGLHFGPRFGTAGSPVVVPARADAALAARLWTRSEQLTGITFDLPAGTR